MLGTDDEKGEWIVSLGRSRDQVLDATHFRSTWLTASRAELRERGLTDAYEALLDSKHRDEVLGAVAGVWLPIDVAYAHYAACDQLPLTAEDLLDLGMKATKRTNATTLAFAARMVQGAGVNPWSILSQGQRLWDRTCRGGQVSVLKLGPKEARLEVVGFPLAALRYNRLTMRGIVSAVVDLFCDKAYVRELPALCNNRCLGYRLSWV